MKRGFSANPDRERAVLAQLDERRRSSGPRRFERECAAVAAELGRCVAEGVTSWAEIAPRLRAVAEE